jgi:opacity protein-like surface antigen
MKKQTLAAVTSILLAVACAPANAADATPSGFYGGVMLRDQGVQRSGMSLGIPANALSRFNVAAIDDSASRALMYGGYRWGNDVAVEASVNSAEAYALRPSDPLRHAFGVSPGVASLGLTDSQSRNWNVDLYTSWSFLRSFSLYGRLGYAQADVMPSLMALAPSAVDTRRLRDGVNYGVGVRYNMTSSLGLRLEYGRFGRFAGEIGSTPLESDQVTFGLQFRF